MSKEETLTSRVRKRIEGLGNEMSEEDFNDLKVIIGEDIREFRSFKEASEWLATYLICTIRSQLGFRAINRGKGEAIHPAAANLDLFRIIMGYSVKDIDDDVATFKHFCRLFSDNCPGESIMVPDKNNVLKIKSIQEIIDEVMKHG